MNARGAHRVDAGLFRTRWRIIGNKKSRGVPCIVCASRPGLLFDKPPETQAARHLVFRWFKIYQHDLSLQENCFRYF